MALPIVPGMRFGRLTVIKQVESTRRGAARYKCRCDCRNVTHPLASSLRNGGTQSCGCLQREFIRKHNTTKAKDITGQRFGRLVALYPTGERRNERSFVRFRCDCGNETEHSIEGLGTKVNSCGCLRKQTARDRAYRHGGSGSPLYESWIHIKERCFDPTDAAFKNYGGRGITVDPQWTSDFEEFRRYINENLGPKPKGYTLDRRNNDGNYEPGNVRWASRAVQNLNSRRATESTKALDALVWDETL